MAKTNLQILESPQFKKVVRDRWTTALILAAAEFILYYGYVLLVAMNKPLVAQKIGKFTTLGIPMGVLVIVISWILTFIYVIWANNKYDPEVEKMVKHLTGGKKK